MIEIPSAEQVREGRKFRFQQGVRNGTLRGMRPGEDALGPTGREHAVAQLSVFKAQQYELNPRYSLALRVARKRSPQR